MIILWNVRVVLSRGACMIDIGRKVRHDLGDKGPL